MQRTEVHEVAEVLAVQAAVVQVAHHIDGRRWSSLRQLFLGTVQTDYTSLFGGTVVEQPADDLIGGWQKIFAFLDATQHLLGPIDVVVRQTDAVAECHVSAYHRASRAASGHDWTVAGHYVFGLTKTDAGWKVRSLKLETYYQTGNLKLLGEASGGS